MGLGREGGTREEEQEEMDDEGWEIQEEKKLKVEVQREIRLQNKTRIWRDGGGTTASLDILGG